jgi:hypothetical protein
MKSSGAGEVQFQISFLTWTELRKVRHGASRQGARVREGDGRLGALQLHLPLPRLDRPAGRTLLAEISIESLVTIAIFGSLLMRRAQFVDPYAAREEKLKEMLRQEMIAQAKEQAEREREEARKRAETEKVCALPPVLVITIF